MTLTISDLDEAVEQKLRVKAASHGRSVEAEVREILTRDVEGTVLNGPSTSTTEVGEKAKGKFDHLIGIWKGRGTTNEMMRELRGDD